MPEKIITLYCFFDELLKAVPHRDDPQSRLSTAEVMTVVAVAAEFFTGNQQAALAFLCSHGYIQPFSKSRLNRRLHRIPETLWQSCLYIMAQIHQQNKKLCSQNQNKSDPEFIVDTFPVPVCRNIRIRRCRIYRNEGFRGYNSSKKEYFYGLKVCALVDTSGNPIELTFMPGSYSDICGLRSMELKLPDDSVIYGDSGFLDLPFEEDLQQDAGFILVVPRRKNMKNQLGGCLQYICGVVRKRVETTFSQLNERFARSIHTVTARGFELKIFLTILAFSIIG